MSKKLIPDSKAIDFQKDDISLLSDVEKGIALESARQLIENRNIGGMRAYLVGVESPETDLEEMKESLSELGALVRTLGDTVIGVAIQKRAKITPATYIGSGKATEIRARCRELKIDYVAFDVDLSPTHVRNLEKVIERPVLDRTEVILQIFRKNAKTREAQTQVEIARLEYLLPRLSNSWIAFERQRGGSGGSARVRGAGEAQLELDKRRMRDKIVSLKKDLEKIATEKSTQRKSRKTELNVVIVGYTNAGKTTLMNAMTDSQLSARDSLFETLDSSVRTLKLSHKPKILLTDTVGFIRNLPHSLIASFQSTLHETVDADLLMHVIDVSHQNYKGHIKVTDQVLKEVGAAEVPRLYVFNKFDALKGEPRLARILSKAYPGCVCISAQNANDIERLIAEIQDFFARNMAEATIEVPYAKSDGENALGQETPHPDQRALGLIYGHTRVIETQWLEDKVVFRVRAGRDFLLKHFPQVLQDSSTLANSEPRSAPARGTAPGPSAGAKGQFTSFAKSATNQSDEFQSPTAATLAQANPWSSGSFSYEAISQPQTLKSQRESMSELELTTDRKKEK